jgi:hypothetical protein
MWRYIVVYLNSEMEVVTRKNLFCMAFKYKILLKVLRIGINIRKTEI